MLQISMATRLGKSQIMSVAVPTGKFFSFLFMQCINAMFSKESHTVRESLHGKIYSVGLGAVLMWPCLHQAEKSKVEILK